MGNSESRASAQYEAGSCPTADPPEDTRHSMPSGSSTETHPPVDRDTTRRHSLAVAPSARQRRHSTARARNASTNVEAGGIERGQQATEDETNQLGYWYLLKNGYTQLVNLVIRPPRATYTMDDLGPAHFTFSGREYHRIDFSVVNDREQTLQCSHWLPVASEVEGVEEFPCLIYLHGNSSCRLESLSVLRTCLASGLTVVAFDCAGCGQSEGDYISLGYYERDDLTCVIKHLREHSKVSTIGLWGRSMGAATALLHADRDPTIAGIIVDSAFTNLEQLITEIVERGRREGYTIPGFMVRIVMKFIRSSVQKRANFDIKRLSPIDHASISFIPALFVAARGDDFIAPHHSEQIYAQYAGDKNIVKVVGDHNSVRPRFLLDSAGIFLQTALHVDARLIPEPTRNNRSRTTRSQWTSGSTPTSSAQEAAVDLEAEPRRGSDGTADLPKDQWACATCTYVNPALQLHCAMCHTTFRPSESALLSTTNSPKQQVTSPSSTVPRSSDSSEYTEVSITSSAFSMSAQASVCSEQTI